ncbi:MAG: T9SS type A sorting domain-containing protein [Bacteroidia bacterium]|nr:T9SS type A sorting domain-containing protein [Bacteroidia bacterium]
MRFTVIKAFSIIFLVLTLNTNAQQWLPLIPECKNHYTCDTGTTIFTLWIDSSRFTGNDIEYYFNRIVFACDTCDSIPTPTNCSVDEIYYLKNQPLFLERECLVNDSILWFHNRHSFVLYTMKSSGSHWLFDTLQGITAIILSRSYEQVLGNYDSVITYQLSTGDTIIHSQNHGIVKFPCQFGTSHYFMLCGIEGVINIGIQIPGFHEIFNHTVGDQYGYIYGKVCPYYNLDANAVFTIDSITEYSDSLVYAVSGFRKGLEDCYGSENDWFSYFSFEPFSSELFYWGTEYEATVIPVWGICDGTNIYDRYSYQLTYNQGMDYYTSQRVFLYNGRIRKETLPFAINTICAWDSLYHPDLMAITTAISEFEKSYVLVEEQTGLIKHDYWQFEVVCGINLYMYIHDGDTIVHLPEKELLVTKHDVFILPNPTKEYFLYSGPPPENIAVYSISGRLELSWDYLQCTIPERLDVKSLKPGVYIVQIRHHGGIAVLNLVVIK